MRAASQSHHWRIDKLVPGGEGMARLADGRVGFAAIVAPGDVIAPDALRTHKGFVRAERFRLVEAGPARIAPPCPVAERCGGCDWMHLSLAAQREHKRGLVAEALRRTGGFTKLPEIAFVAEGPDLGYRRRLRLHVGPDGRVGFFAPRSHDIVEVQQCLVADADVNRALAALRAGLAAHPEAARVLEEVEIRTAPEEPRIAVSLFPRRAADATALASLVGVLEPIASVSVAGQAGERTVQRLPLTDRVALDAPPGIFTQVNWQVNRRVIADLVAEARRRGVARVLDLYAGAGNFTLPLAAAGLDVLGIEQDPRAVRAGRHAADAAGLRARLRHADAEREAGDLVRRREKFDLVVLDPPRAGAGAAIDHVAALADHAVAFVSCDPVTLARDLRRLTTQGFTLDAVCAYDMFPHTHHVEVVAWCSRST